MIMPHLARPAARASGLLGAGLLLCLAALPLDAARAQSGTAPAGTSPAEATAATTAAPAAPGIALGSTGLTLTSTAAVSNDYLFRGISQTRNNWAFSGTFDLAHESGVYVGAFISNAKFLASPYNNTRQELDLLAGYRFTVADINFDIGYIAYLYPGQEKPEGTQLNEYQEVALKVNYTFGEAGALGSTKLSAAVNYSPNFFGRSGAGWYVEGGLDVTLPFEITGFGRLGHQWIQNNTRFGTPDYLWYAVGIQRPIWGPFTAAVGWYGTNISKSECAPVAERATGGQRICEGRVLFTLSATF
jgi:uncharacterized protein (TIGR02001 family)